MNKTRWSSYSIFYHIVWCPKYRRKVLDENVAKALKGLIAEFRVGASAHESCIYSGIAERTYSEAFERKISFPDC